MAGPSPIIRCQNCGGRGWLEVQRGQLTLCPTCRGVGLAVWRGDQWWSWQQPISDFSIFERHLEHIVKALVSALLMVFFLVGLWFGGRHILESIGAGQALKVLFLESSWPMVAWWFGLLCMMYLVYRLERDLTMFPKIPTVNLAAPPAPPGEPWVGRIPPRDIGLVCNEATHDVLDHAWRLARDNRRRDVAPVHILVALSTTAEIGSMLVRMGIPPATLQQRLIQLGVLTPAGNQDPTFNTVSRQLLVEAFSAAAADRRTRISPPYLLAAMANIEDPVRELLYDLDIDDAKMKHVISWLKIQADLRQRVQHYQAQAAAKPKGVVDRGYTAAATPILDRFSVDLTALARVSRLPYVIGREQELKSILRIMASGRRSVLVVGDSGVGKTHMLYALAERMATEDVPEILQDKRLVSLSASALVAGAGAVGELEDRIQRLLEEIHRSGNIVLAIENLDQLIGVSSAGQGLDAAQMLAEALQHHLFAAVATANVQDYRRVLENSSIMSVFEKVDLGEMDADRALEVLESRVGSLENRHQIFYTFDALEQAVKLSERYLHEKTLPGKALELLEEAGVLVRKMRGPRGLVGGPDVAAIVSERAQVKVSEVTADEQTKLLNLEAELHRRVIGQDEAVKAVANALRRARAELRDVKRPIASLLFIGPTGVGKTELARTLAEVYFGSEESMIRMDMSEYQEIGSISRMLGAPPGYAGSSGGYLTEAVRAKSFSLLLLDELEKAHPDILNLFLQVMDDGRLTDSSGRTIDFTNVILIATSNAGTQFIQERLRDGAALPTIKEELMTQQLLQYFRPEFINRFDSIVLFTPLSPLEIQKIVRLMLDQIAKKLADKGISLRASPEAIAELALKGFDPLYGARPLRRAVQENVDNALATFLLTGKLGRRDVAVLEAGGTIRVEQAQKI